MRILLNIIFIILFILQLNSCKKHENPTNNEQINYDTVKICNHLWMKKNLDIDHYRNGDSIPEVRDSTQWMNLKTGAWRYYKNDPANGKIYGKLYNWYAVNDPRGLAPLGWHIASDKEWSSLWVCLGFKNNVDSSIIIVANKMRESGSKHWLIQNESATNESNFTGLPGGCFSEGYLNIIGWNYYAIGNWGIWWTSTESSDCCAWWRALGNNISVGSSSKACGYSVRCIKD